MSRSKKVARMMKEVRILKFTRWFGVVGQRLVVSNLNL